MRSRSRWCGCLLTLLTLGCSKPAEPEAIVVAQLASVGPAGRTAETVRQAAELAVAAANADGPAFDGRPWVVVQPPADEKADDVQRTAVRLIKLNRASALLACTDAAAAERLCRTAEQYRVPLIATWWLPPRTLRPYGFTVAPSPADRARAVAAALPTDPAPSVALLVDARSDFAQAFAEAFVAALPATAKVNRQDYADADGLKAVVKKGRPTVLVLAGRAADLAVVRAEMPPADAAPIVFAGEEEAAVAAAAAANADGNPLVWTTPFMADAEDQRVREFVDRFSRRYQTVPDAAAALAYDGARALFEAQRQAKTTDGGKVRDQLAGMKDFPGVTGTLSFGPEPGPRPVFVVHRLGGKVVPWKAQP